MPRSLRSGRSTGVKPWNADTFTVSTDPELKGKVVDIVGLYSIRRRTRSCLPYRKT
jgi:hypothetical protein